MFRAVILIIRLKNGREKDVELCLSTMLRHDLEISFNECEWFGDRILESRKRDNGSLNRPSLIH